ncbi:hypothetical protein SAMN05216388_100449 [Halorientalis persicus]|jgi:hypothetical protein|uniref:DUF7979 domain-containing protein n=1 Tax=Halorientalis persicus TaxID=1367881 RepID=A0A1H8I384_9EURY|nr:hypothetical protein [Halorientalis persicus]SEN62318.1 hypothetical protein SAMN05216388_100449 [Halorientalis persicus]
MDLGRGRLMVFVGVVLIVAVAAGGFVLWDTDFVHRGEPASDEFNASQKGHLRYANLSERGRTIVDRTVERGEYVVESEGETAPDFRYTTDHSGPGIGWYLVQRDGRVHEITTYRDSPGFVAPVLTMVVLFPLAMLGSALLAFGAWRQRNDD